MGRIRGSGCRARIQTGIKAFVEDPERSQEPARSHGDVGTGDVVNLRIVDMLGDGTCVGSAIGRALKLALEIRLVDSTSQRSPRGTSSTGLIWVSIRFWPPVTKAERAGIAGEDGDGLHIIRRSARRIWRIVSEPTQARTEHRPGKRPPDGAETRFFGTDTTQRTPVSLDGIVLQSRDNPSGTSRR